MDKQNILLSFYGDDFTGSTDAMESLARAGMRTICFIHPPTVEQLAQYEGIQAFGVAGVSRSLATEEMESELNPVYESFRRLAPPVVHYKTCSTFDSSPEIGSIGKAVDIGVEYFNTKTVPMLVAAPVLGRHCVFGNLFARSGADAQPIRLDRHPTMSRHPITPMDESDLRQHLAKQTDKSIELFDILSLNQAGELRNQRMDDVLQSSPEILMFDALYQEQMALVGGHMWKMATQSKPLYIVGSSGVEYALTAYWAEQGMISNKPLIQDPGEVTPVLILSGSCSPVTKGQIERGIEAGFKEVSVKTEVLCNIEMEEREIERVVQSAIDLMGQKHNVVVHTAIGPDDERIQRTKDNLSGNGTSGQSNKFQSGKFLGEALGKIMLKVSEKFPVKRVAVTGGDTSGYFAKYIGVESLEMIQSIAPGVPLCTLGKPGSSLQNIEITFKSGQLGLNNFFESVAKGKLVSE